MLEKLGVGAIFFGAMLINAITGFAGNLLAMPGTIQLIGMTDAKVVSTIVGLFSCFIIAMMGIKNVIWHEVTKITLFMIPGIAIGFYLFYTLDLSFLLYIYGTVIVLIALKSFFTKQGLYNMSLPLLVFVMLCAGLMQGLFVSGGAFVVVYAVHTFKNKEEFRSTLSVLWVVLNTILLIQEGIAGEITPQNSLLSFYVLIPSLLGVYFGNRLHHKISGKGFLLLSNILLLISGIVCFFKV